MAGHLIYHWKHGWIPLTHAAALSKAHGSVRGAEKYVPGASHHHGSLPTRGMSARAVHAKLQPHSNVVGRDLTQLSDESLSRLLNGASDHEIEHVLGELNRRDKLERQRRRAAERRAVQDAAKDRQYDDMVSAGHDPESAYAEVYGVTIERQRRNQVISALRDNGFKGAGFDVLTRNAYQDYLEQQFWHAENFTKGHWFRGKTNVNERRNPRRLFDGSETYARANASEELLAYWQEHGRMTLEDFRAAMLGGQLKAKGRAAWH